MQVLAFRHAPLEGIGTIGSALDRHNVAYRVVDAYLDSDDARGLGDADGLIVMGGPMSANDDLPWLRREIGAIQEAVDRGVPVRGCERREQPKRLPSSLLSGRHWPSLLHHSTVFSFGHLCRECVARLTPLETECHLR